MASSPMATVMDKVGPKIGDVHTWFRKNPVVLTLDVALFLIGVGSIGSDWTRPLYHKIYYRVTGKVHEEVNKAEIMRNLPARVDKLEKRVTMLEESRGTFRGQAPAFNTPAQAARNIIRRASSPK